MKPEHQIVAIAESRGWRLFSQFKNLWAPPRSVVEYDCDAHPLPDYLNDLNAMSVALDTLNNDQQWQFIQHLNNITRNTDHNDPDDWFVQSTDWTWRMVNATATQRAEAFLRTIGKWETSQ
jgi:hypothetical protein